MRDEPATIIAGTSAFLRKFARWQGFSRILRDATLVTSSSGFTAVCIAVALGFNARSLGPMEFGVLSVIQAYKAFIGTVAAFESWQPVIRLGVKSPSRLGLTISCGIVLDLAAAVTAAIIAIGAVLLFGELIGLSEKHRVLAIIFSASLAGGVGGTPKGFFRLKGRYDVLVGNQVMQGLALVAAAVVLWALNASLLTYVVVLSVIGVLYNLSLLMRLLLLTRRDGIRISNPLCSRMSRRYLFMFLGMATGTSLFSTLINTRRHIALFLVASILGEVAAGLYGAAARLAAMVSRVTTTLNQVIFPEILRKFAKTQPDDWAKSACRITVLAAFVACCMAIAGVLLREPIVLLAVGSAYADASLIFAVLFVAECFGLAGLHFNPMIQSLAGMRPLLLIAAPVIIASFPLAAVLGAWTGAVGIALAGLVASAAIYLGMMGTARTLLLRRRDVQPSNQD